MADQTHAPLDHLMRRGLWLAALACLLGDLPFWLPHMPWGLICRLTSLLAVTGGSILFLIGLSGAMIYRLVHKKRLVPCRSAALVAGAVTIALLAIANAWPAFHGSDIGWPHRGVARSIDLPAAAYFNFPPWPAAYFLALDGWHAVLCALVAGWLVGRRKELAAPADGPDDRQAGSR